jgi:hypothetical protein
MYTSARVPKVMSTPCVAVLVQSDTWRDGGSLSATVLDGDRQRSFWLQTNRWDHPRDSGHENLFVSEGERPESKDVMIGIASTEEWQWLTYLQRVDDASAEPESRLRFRQIVDALRVRHSATPT